MRRFLKSIAQLLLIWSAIVLSIAVAGAMLAAIDPLHDVPYVGARGKV